MAEQEFTPGKNLDMTPWTALNWQHRSPPTVPTLLVNPQASLHDRVALAYAMVGELCAITGGAANISDDNVPRFVVSLVSDRLDRLHDLLSDIGDRTSCLPALPAA